MYTRTKQNELCILKILKTKNTFFVSAGLMNPGGRKESLIAVLMVLQWILPFMMVISSGGSQILTLLKKVIKVNYEKGKNGRLKCADFNHRRILGLVPST